MGWKKFFKVAVAIVGVALVGPLAAAIGPAVASVVGQGIAASVISGAVAGAVVGGVSAAVTGGDWKKGALLGAVGGGISGGLIDYSAGLNKATTIAPEPSGASAPQSGALPAETGAQLAPPPPQVAPQPVSSPQAAQAAPQAAQAAQRVTASGALPQVTKPAGMLESALGKITEITKAHPWTADLMKGTAEALFKGVASANTPTQGEQLMELDAFRQQMNSRSITGLGPDPFAPNPLLAQRQNPFLLQQQQQPFVPFGSSGMLRLPGG